MKFNNLKVAVIGGDSRMLYAANAFCDAGAECAVFANNAFISDSIRFTRAFSLSDALGSADLVVLPIPATRDGYALNAPFNEDKIFICELAKQIPLHATVCAGIAQKELDLPEHSVLDYGSDEFFCTQNGILTAEGAISLAIENSKISLQNSECCIFGFGRIGKALAARLKAFDACVTVFARNPKDRTFIEYCGFDFANYKDCDTVIEKCDFLFNTVPDSQIASLYRASGPSTLVIELAGQSKSHCNVINAASLPSVYSPKSAGRLIFETIARNYTSAEGDLL